MEVLKLNLFSLILLGYGSAFGEKYGNADRVEVACAALVRHGYSYIGKVDIAGIEDDDDLLSISYLFYFIFFVFY